MNWGDKIREFLWLRPSRAEIERRKEHIRRGGSWPPAMWSPVPPPPMRPRVATIQQSPPVVTDHPAAWDLVAQDIAERDKFGLSKYGTRLQPHNGRDSMVDVYQELLDVVVYMRQMLYERDGR